MFTMYILDFAPGLEGLDQRVSLWMNSNYCSFGDVFWTFMSGVKVWFAMYALIAALILWRLGWKRGLVAIACIALAFFLDERVNNLIKHLVERVRPCNNPLMIEAGVHILETGGGWSFPSGHACNSFGFALSSALCLKFGAASVAGVDGLWRSSVKLDESSLNRRDKVNGLIVNVYGVFIITWAFLVGVSRVMVARHFLGDVFVGAVIGSLMGVLWAFIARFVYRKF